MIRVFINNSVFYIKKDISILEALSFLGLRIPRFCYHEALSVAGNCRICLVEIDSSFKLVASCAQPILNNMQIFSNTIKVIKTRENIMESLLLNHPLDCPICDQAGECDLQDQSKIFGGISTRYFFSKRGVEDKNIDPCIKTIMTRCIHCTRCVRFASEIAGYAFLGTLNRGRFTEIGSFVNFFHSSSEISGNMIDLCPVGALTAKPYAFKARPWELRSIETIDLTDGLGSNIFINLKELQIISILPKNNPMINGQWISNKARFYSDALQRYRLLAVFLKDKNNVFVTKPVNSIVSTINTLQDISKIIFVINPEVDLKTICLLKKAENAEPLKFKVYSISNYNKSNNYYYNKSNKISNLDLGSHCFVLVATNIRVECTVLNIKLKIKAKNKKVDSLSLGLRMDAVFPTKFINVTIGVLLNLFEGKVKYLSNTIFCKSSPIFLIGESFFQRCSLNPFNIVSYLSKYSVSSNILIINKKSNIEAIRYLNVKPIVSKNLLNNGTVYFCNLEDSLINRKFVQKITLQKIWLNTHGSLIASYCDLIIPILSYFEADGLFINLEKRPQKAVKVVENGNSYIYSAYEFIEVVLAMLGINVTNKCLNSLLYIDEIIKKPDLFNKFFHKFLTVMHVKSVGVCLKYPFKPVVSNFYFTNSYTRYSLNMLTCSAGKSLKNNVFLSLPI